MLKKEGNRWQPDSYSSYRELSQLILGVSSSSVSAVNGSCLNPFLVQACNHLQQSKVLHMGKFLVWEGELKFCSSLRELYNIESSCTCLIRPFVLTEVAYGQDREVINSIVNTKIISLDCIHNNQCHTIYPWIYF